MTNKQMYNLSKINSFANNVGKLSVGRSTTLTMIDEKGDDKNMVKVTCDTVGQYPRLFTVSSPSAYLPSGKGYTYKRIMHNLFDNLTWPL